MARGGKQIARVVLDRQHVRSRCVELNRERQLAARRCAFDCAFAMRLRFKARPFPLGRRMRRRIDRTECLQVEIDRFLRLRKRLGRRQAIRCRAARDQHFTRHTHLVGRAVLREQRQRIPARFFGGGQRKARVTVAIGRKFLLFQLDREQPGITQFTIDDRHFLRTQRDRHLAVAHRLAVRIAQLDLALQWLARRIVGFIHRQVDVEMRLHIFGDAKCAAIYIAVVIEAQLITAGGGIGGKRERGIRAGIGSKMHLAGRHRRAVRVEHIELDIGIGRRSRLRRVLECTTDKLHMHRVARPVHRTVGHRVDLGVVDLAVVIEILRDEHAALRIGAEYVAALGAHVLQHQRPVVASGTALQHAYAVGPAYVGIRHRLAVIAPGSPHQHAARRRFYDRDRIRHKQQGMRAIVADHRLDDIQPRW